jgi:imidazolonepropionase-like amidohydrolase
MLKAAISSAGELLSLTRKTTYHVGKIGVVEKGAYADLLLLDGDPLADISVIGGNELWLKAPVPQPIETIKITMKDGVIFKNTL